ncbi:MAG: WYL domain-containing protein [Salinivirgaceae bacterium]|nr:WYL domain-containing protein [Salinivirgaceae bacterium]
MSKRETIARYTLIINKVRKNPATFAEIKEHLERESELQGYNFDISKRTFDRDRDDISSLYNIDICYDFSRRVYCIDNEGETEVRDRILEAFDTFNALNISDRLSDIVHFEKRRPQGSEHLYGMMHAIRNNLQIRFFHQKFWDESETFRTIEPYALKEFKNRWYVVGKDLKDNRIKSFGLDRLHTLEITKVRCASSNGFDVNEHYKYCFGIVGPSSGEPKEILLSFDPTQGKYIKSMPLHASQTIIKDDETELQIGLTLHLTFDFIMEILSHSNKVKVLKPESLRTQIKELLLNTLSYY